MEKKTLTRESLQQRLTSIRSDAAEGAEISSEQWALRESVAMRVHFDTPQLPKADRHSLVLFLTGDCDRVLHHGGSRRWALSDAGRRATLARMAREGRLRREAESYIGSTHETERIMAQWILGDEIDLGELDAAALTAASAVLPWLVGIVHDLPSTGEVRAQVARAELLQPFRDLVGDHFLGREHELRTIRSYVDVLPAEGTVEGIARGTRRIFSTRRNPLLITGPGGVGKSTLLARFILDHLDPTQSSLLFVYLNFDRPDLIPTRPVSVLTVALEQILTQLPEKAPSAEREMNLLRDLLTDPTRSDGPDPEAVDAFVRAVGSIAGDRPLLIVADTFEEVQRRGEVAVGVLDSTLIRIQRSIPAVRTVVSGRAPVTSIPTEILEIGDFDKTTANELLRRLLEDVDIDDQVVELVVDRVGRNPLSLKLAAQVVRLEGASAINDVRSRSVLWFQLREAEIQGQLYRRILDHLLDPDLRKIANPGLVLRRITPEIIEDVLAEPCDLDLSKPRRGEALFQMLATEASLVSLSDDGSTLFHRPDVRRAMLPLIVDDNPELAIRINRKAVAYYKKQLTKEALAEEIYHRLALGQARSTIDQRWSDEVIPYLEGVIDELPPAGQAYLGPRLGINVEPRVLQYYDNRSWIRQTSRTVELLLASGRLKEGLNLLRERRYPDGDSLVPVLEARVLLAMERVNEATVVIDGGLARTAEEDEAEDFMELVLLAAEAAERRGLLSDALQYLDEAHATSLSLGDQIRLLRIEVAQLRVLRRLGESYMKRRDEVTQMALDHADRMSRRDWLENASLLRDLVAEIGMESATLFSDGLEIAGVGELDGKRLQQLANALKEWDAKISDALGLDDSLLDSAQKIATGTDWSAWLEGQSAAQMGKNINQLWKQFEGQIEPVRQVVTDILKADVDKAH